jgi:hypothetical protein
MDVFSQGDAALALGYRMYKPFGLFTPHRISYRSLDPVDYTHPSHNFGRCTRDIAGNNIEVD